MATRTKAGAEKHAEDGFSADERAAMKERAAEAKRGRGTRADPEAEVLERIAEMPEEDRTLAQGIHDLVRATAPELTPRLWYGMPAYARDGKVVCFFQGATKFKTRYATLGFSDRAALDDGAMWPTAYAVTKLTAGVRSDIAALVRTARS